MTYDALDNDIALLNVYFGRVQLWVSTKQKDKHLMYSEYERTLKRTTIEIMVDMAAWFGELIVKRPFPLNHRCLLGNKRSLPC